MIPDRLKTLDRKGVVEDADSEADGAAESIRDPSAQSAQLHGKFRIDLGPSGLRQKDQVGAKRRDQEKPGSRERPSRTRRNPDQPPHSTQHGRRAAEFIGRVAPQPLDGTESEELLRGHLPPGHTSVSPRSERQRSKSVSKAD